MERVRLYYLAGRNVSERGTDANSHIDEVVDTRNMRQVEDMDERPGSGRGEEQKFVIPCAICALSVKFHVQRLGYIRSRSYILYLSVFVAVPILLVLSK